MQTLAWPMHAVCTMSLVREKASKRKEVSTHHLQAICKSQENCWTKLRLRPGETLFENKEKKAYQVRSELEAFAQVSTGLVETQCRHSPQEGNLHD